MWPAAPLGVAPSATDASPAVLAAEYVLELSTRHPEPDIVTSLALQRLLRTALATDPTTADRVESTFASQGHIPVAPATVAAVNTTVGFPECAPDMNADVSLILAHAGALAVTDPTGAITLLRALEPLRFPEIAEALARTQLCLATKLRIAGLVHEARTLASQAATNAPNLTAAHIVMAEVALDANFPDPNLAEKHYRTAIALDPMGTLDAQVALAVVLRSRQDINAAIALLESVLVVDPENDAAKAQLAISLCDSATTLKETCTAGQKKAIRALYKRALSVDPNYPDGHYNLAVAYAEDNKPDRASTHYSLAITTRKARFGAEYPEAHNNLGVLAKTKGNPLGAIGHYSRAIDAAAKVIADPSQFSQSTAGILHQIQNNMAVVLTLMGRTSQARSHLEQALILMPRYVEGLNNVGVLCREEGKFREALDAYTKAKLYAKALPEYDQGQLFPSPGDMAAQNRLHMLNYDLDVYSAEQVFLEHKSWGLEFEDKTRALFPDTASRACRFNQNWIRESEKRTGTEQIRIGLLSGDFYTHSVSYFAECLLAIDPQVLALQIFVYSNTPTADAKTAKFLAYPSVQNQWRDVYGRQTDVVAGMIMDDRVDILFDLAGHTAGNRLDVMALKPAPIQATWIGYPNTTGLPSVDYRITDDRADPRWTSQQFTETLYRLPDVFLCYTPGADFPDVRSLPVDSRADGFITFGSFNILAKMRPATVTLWATVLRRIPKSRLLLKAKAFTDLSSQQRVESMFYGQGVCPSRLCLLPMAPTTQAHLETYGQVDIGLDPFPYAGTTTTCEALYMGVPVISFATQTGSEFHAQNVGATLLACIGHEELITRSEDQFVYVAQELARDISRLRRLRSNLRQEMMRSPLGDGVRFMVNVEQMCRNLVESKLQQA